jgi:hypothetical protein
MRVPSPNVTALVRDLGQLLATYVSGDLGDLTLYTSKTGKIVAYPRTKPCKPPTRLQQIQRNRFRLAQHNWELEPVNVKVRWEQATLLLSLDITGQNAYISQALSPDPDSLTFVLKRTGIVLIPPFPVPR